MRAAAEAHGEPQRLAARRHAPQHAARAAGCGGGDREGGRAGGPEGGRGRARGARAQPVGKRARRARAARGRGEGAPEEGDPRPRDEDGARDHPVERAQPGDRGDPRARLRAPQPRAPRDHEAARDRGGHAPVGVEEGRVGLPRRRRRPRLLQREAPPRAVRVARADRLRRRVVGRSCTTAIGSCARRRGR